MVGMDKSTWVFVVIKILCGAPRDCPDKFFGAQTGSGGSQVTFSCKIWWTVIYLFSQEIWGWERAFFSLDMWGSRSRHRRRRISTTILSTQDIVLQVKKFKDQHLKQRETELLRLQKELDRVDRSIQREEQRRDKLYQAAHHARIAREVREKERVRTLKRLKNRRKRAADEDLEPYLTPTSLGSDEKKYSQWLTNRGYHRISNLHRKRRKLTEERGAWERDVVLRKLETCLDNIQKNGTGTFMRETQRNVLLRSLIPGLERPPHFIDDQLCECGRRCEHLVEESIFVCPDPSCGRARTRQTVEQTYQKPVEPKCHAYKPYMMYRRNIWQFLDTANKPLLSTVDHIYRNISDVHILGMMRCGHATVSQIMRKENQQHLASTSSVLARRMNGEPVPQFSQAMIERLEDRSKKICEAQLESDSKDASNTMFNCSYLTKKFLMMEGDVKTSMMFSLLKTPFVLDKSDRRFRTFCQKLDREDNFRWPFHRSC